MRVLGQWSEYSEKPWCPHHFILFFYSDLTAAFTCSVLAHLMDGWPFEPEFELASIRFSRRQPQPPWAPERGPCRKLSGGGPGRKSLPLKDLTPHRPTWRRREHLSGYRSRQAQARASGAIRVLGWKPSETGKNRPPTGHLGLFGPFSHVVTIDRGNLRAAREGFHSEPTNGFLPLSGLPLSGQKSSNLRPGGKTPRWRSGLYFKRAEFWHRTGSRCRCGRGSGCFEVSHLLAYRLRYDTKLDSNVSLVSLVRETDQ